MSRHLGNTPPDGRSFPRVSGDEPGKAIRTLVWGEFSPRERG